MLAIRSLENFVLHLVSILCRCFLFRLLIVCIGHFTPYSIQQSSDYKLHPENDCIEFLTPPTNTAYTNVGAVDRIRRDGHIPQPSYHLAERSPHNHRFGSEGNVASPSDAGRYVLVADWFSQSHVLFAGHLKIDLLVAFSGCTGMMCIEGERAPTGSKSTPAR